MSTLTVGTRVRVINQSPFHGKLGQVIRREDNPATAHVRLDGGNPKGQPFLDVDLVPLTASFSTVLYPDQPHGNRTAATVVGGYREDFVGNPPTITVDNPPTVTVGIAGHSTIPPMQIGSTFTVR